jgi:hypothetical protein
VDLNLLSLGKIEDLYHDQQVFYKTLVKGQGSAVPYFDCKVTLRVKIEVDGEVKADMFKIAEIEEFKAEVVAGDCLIYDLEEFQVPGVVRKLLKITKPFEIVQLTCTRKDKLTDHLPDAHGIFNHEYFENFEDKVTITYQLLHIDQKEYLFKLPIGDKVKRVLFLKDISTALFKEQKYHKAEKVYKRMHEFFKGNDAKNNFVKEDEESEEYKECSATLDGLRKVNLTNLAVICIKKKDNH